MSLGETLFTLRKKKGLSQEQAAEFLHVTRQTISKWETGQTTPEFNKLAPLSRLYGISMDDLVKHAVSEKDRCSEDQQQASEPADSLCGQAAQDSRHEGGHIQINILRTPICWHFEYKSKRRIRGVPLVHIHLGRGFRTAKGIIAIGNIAQGILSIGLLSMGVFSFGLLSLGIAALGCLTLAAFAVGGLAAGLLAVGGAAFGYFAVGGLAVGVYALGGCAIAADIACGGYASGHIAIGDSVRGVYTFLRDAAGSGSGGTSPGADPEMVREAILREFPHIWKSIADFFVSLS